MPLRRSLLFLLFCTATISAADWPQWLGANRDCSSPEIVAPWKTPLKVLWHKPVGDGHSSPVVAGGKVFLHTKVADKDQEQISAYDAKTGEFLWHTAYDRASFFSVFGVGPQATPAVADGKVYTYGVTGILSCFDAANGKERWRIDALKELKAKNLFFGAACSPLVDGDNVFVAVGGEGASVVAFKTDKGEVAWKNLDAPASYSSPILFGKEKDRQLVFLTGAGLASLDPTDGKAIWQYPVKDEANENSATPVHTGDTLLASTVKFGGVALKLETKDGKSTAIKAWKNPELTCYFSTPVAVGSERIYMVTGQFGLLAATSTLCCVETKTGKELWKKEKVGKYHAALLRTGNDKLLMLDDFGNLTLLDPDATEYKELSRSKVCGATWAHPALSDGRVYLRDDKELICVEVPTK
jgi:outer membrane protein assembly factor BamB